jgi:hypothetical protein
VVDSSWGSTCDAMRYDGRQQADKVQYGRHSRVREVRARAHAQGKNASHGIASRRVALSQRQWVSRQLQQLRRPRRARVYRRTVEG